MLSSVSYVCLGVCAGMWVISRGYIFGRAGFVFHLGLAVPAFGSFLFVFDFLGGVCVLFAYILQMFSALVCGWIFGLRFPGIQCFTIPYKFSSGCCVGWQSTQYFLQVFFFLQQMEVLGTRTWIDSFPASPFHFPIYLRHLMTEAKTASLPGVSSSQHCLVSPAG